MFLKGTFFSAEFEWDTHLSVRNNVLKVISAYLPYRFNALTKKTHIEEAKDAIAYLETHTKITDCELYLFIQLRRQELSEENGEYKKIRFLRAKNRRAECPLQNFRHGWTSL